MSTVSSVVAFPEYLDEQKKKLIRDSFESVIPIYGLDARKRYVHIGSACLVIIKSYCFLITAGHVVETHLKQKADVFVSCGDGFETIAYSNPVFTAESEAAIIDFAIIPFEPSDEFAKQYKFVDASEILWGMPTNMLCWFTGYPQNRTKFYKEAQKLVNRITKRGILTKCISDVSTHKNKLQYELRFDRLGDLISGAEIVKSDPHGMSGGGLWFLNSQLGRGFDDVGNMKKKLGGIIIQTEEESYLKSNKILCLDIRVVMQFIRENYDSTGIHDQRIGINFMKQ